MDEFTVTVLLILTPHCTEQLEEKINFTHFHKSLNLCRLPINKNFGYETFLKFFSENDFDFPTAACGLKLFISQATGNRTNQSTVAE